MQQLLAIPVPESMEMNVLFVCMHDSGEFKELATTQVEAFDFQLKGFWDKPMWCKEKMSMGQKGGYLRG